MTQTFMPQIQKVLAKKIKPEPKNTARMVDDIRKDPVFRLGVSIIRALAADVSVSINVESSTDEPRAQALADNLLDVWDQSIYSALNAIEYGRQAFEIIHGLEGSINTIHELCPIPFELSKLKIDKESGSPVGVEVGSGGDSIELAPRYAWWFALDATDINPYGVSRYSGAPWDVRQRRKALDKQEEIWFERFSQGNGLARAPDQSKSDGTVGKGDIGEIDSNGEPMDYAKILDERFQQLKAGGFLILPSTQYRQDEGSGYLWDVTTWPELKDGAAILARRNNLDVAALRSLGIPERALIQEGQTGAYALAQAHQTVMNDMINGIARQVVTSFQRQVIDRMVQINGIDGSLVMTWRKVGDRTTDRFNQFLTSAIQSTSPSIMLTSVIDFIGMMESEGVPIQEGARNTLKRIADMSMSAQPATSFGQPSQTTSLALDWIEEAIRERDQVTKRLSFG